MCRGWDCGGVESWSDQLGGREPYPEMVDILNGRIIGEESVVEKAIPRFDDPSIDQIQEYVAVSVAEIG